MNSKKEKLLNETYYKWMQAGLYDLPLDQIKEFIDPNIMGYGSAIDEKVLSISDYRELINRQREQAVGLEMSFEITPVFRSISTKEDSAIFVDEIKVSIIVNEDKQELFLRITTILEYIDSKWIVVHWHGSIPTETTAETDAWLVNEWKRKNEELQKLVEEKTSELLNKNRELEIETALEKVRSSALAMKDPTDMLEVCRIISDQLQSLGVNEIRNVQTAIFYETKKTYINFEYYTKHSKSIITEVDYRTHELQELFASKMIKGVGELFIETLKSKEVKDWYAYQKTTNQFADTFLETAESLIYYWYSLGPVALGMSTYVPLNEQEINLFKRFRNVFELAYRRFLDIQQAEAQAKEAKIEASLEKVRAVAMSMNKPDDLLNICEVLFKEFQKLGFDELRNSMINIHNDEKGTFLNYDYSDEIGKSINHLTYNIHPVIEKQIKQIRSANDAFSETSFTGKDLEEWKKFRNKIGEKDDQRIDNISALYYYFYSIGTGSIGISTFSSIGDEKLELLKRFRNVFSLSYQRYLDIALAEAQAREAQIEAALERVRSRTMGMQKSDELLEAGEILFLEMQKLGIESLTAGYVLMDKEEKNGLNYAPNPLTKKILPSPVIIPHNETVHMQQVVKNWKKGNSFFIVEMNEAETIKHQTFIAERSINFPLNAAQLIAISPAKLFLHNFYFKEGYLLIVGGLKLSAEQTDIMLRFTKVFQQTYTRFLDLQKAEAQAMEAQIEAALERVRSRTMGMQKSEELKDVIRVVYEQFVHLKINVDHAGFLIDYTPKSDWHFWIADEQDIPSKITHPYFESVWANQFNEAKEKGADFFATNLNFEEKNKFYNELLPYVPGLPEVSKDFYLSCPGLAASTVVLENVSLYIENFSGIPYTDEDNNTLMRFGKVFQQTYTRFLDLQKAEAQAREAQIEAALERVRSRAMAMHSPNDLSETVNVFFKELKTLGIIPIRCGVGQIEEATRTTSLTTTTSSQQGETFRVIGKIKQTGHPVLDGIFDHWKLQKEFHPVLQGEDINVYYNVMNAQIGYPEYPAEITQYGNIFFFKEGFVFAWTANLLSEEELIIFRRFTSVLSLTYRRYLDLKEAEEQAKEARIEASLEKVRTVALSLKKSDEMLDIAQVLYEQLIELGFINIRNAIIDIHNDKNETFQGYDYSHDMGRTVTLMSYYDDPIIEKKVREIESSSDAFFELILEGQDLQDLIDVRLKNGEEEDPRLRQIKQLTYNLYSFGNGAIGISNFGLLNNEQKILLKRFRNVFAFAYKRYSDLAQAESQAREAQIEASLERVRSKAMAMHSPNDLSETVNVFFKELKTLGIIPIRCGVGQIDETTRTTSLTTTTSSQQGDSFQVIGEVKQTGHPVLDGIFDHWKLQKEYHPVLEGENIKTYYDVMNAQIGYPEYPEGVTQYGNNFFFKEGFVFAWTENLLSEEELTIFRRFTSVLSLTYRRYMDLKEAEAQAREARIEAALERTRTQSMIMQHSKELDDTLRVFHEQVLLLGINSAFSFLWLPDEEKDQHIFWAAWAENKSGSTAFKSKAITYSLNRNEPATAECLVDWKSDKPVHSYAVSPAEVENYFVAWKELIDGVEKLKPEHFPGGLYYVEAFMKYGCFGVMIENEMPEEEKKILGRFAVEFERTYTRFLDLQKAEAQNKIIQADNDRKTKELEEARQLQLSMLPKELPELPHLDIAVYMKTATEVGGDYYDFHVQPDGTLTALVGDATGHGMMSGMMVSIMKSFFISHRTNIELKRFFENSNNSIKDMHLGRLMMALIGVQFTSEKVIATNAGMPSLLYFRNKSQKAGEFVSNNLPLGGMKDISYSLKEIRYEKGDTLLLMSDGFAELKNENDEQYGYSRLKEEFKSVAQKSPNEIVEYLKNSASKWANGVEPNDDVTFVVINVK